MTTLKYIQENPDLTEAGYQFGEQMSLFVDQAACADYTADDGENFQLAIDEFWETETHVPRKIYERLGSEKGIAVREIVMTLFNPRAYLDSWRRDELKEALASALTKEELVEAFDQWARACNEFFRLKWLVLEHGGWRKEDKQ